MSATEFLFSFDTTGNLYSLLKCMEDELSTYLKELLLSLPHLNIYRLGVITHGGYTDARHVSVLRLTNQQTRIKNFVSQRNQSKGDPNFERSYELAIREANRVNWHKPSTKYMIMIGNGIPHAPEFSSPIVDWRTELQRLVDRRIKIFTVHIGKNDASRHFFQEVADRSNGFYFNLQQYRSFIPWLDMFLYSLCNDGKIDKDLFNEVPLEVEYNIRRYLKLYPLPKPPSPEATGLQVLDVIRQTNIKRFMKEYRILKPKQVFYELTEPTVIKPFKEILLYSPRSGEFVEGYKCRQACGLTTSEPVLFNPNSTRSGEFGDFVDFVVFYEPSTHAQKLLPGMRFIWRENNTTSTPISPLCGEMVDY